MSEGRYIIIVQADDRLASKTILSELYELLRSEYYDLFASPVICEDFSGRTWLFTPNRFYRYRYKFKNCFRSQGTFIHRRLFDEIGFFREDLEINMDYDFYYRAMQHRCKIGLGKKPIAIMGRQGVSSREENTVKRIAVGVSCPTG